MSTDYENTVRELKGNPEHLDAFQATGHCVTLAGPGSGKTKVLTATMARVLHDEVRAPHGVACVTYNNECARELERRLEALGVADLPNLFVGTLHSFCLRHILRPFGHLAHLDLPTPIRIAPTSIQGALVGEAMAAVGVTAEGFRTELDRFRRTALDRIDGIDGWEVGDHGLTDVCLEYEARLRSHGLIDFDDIVLLALRAVESSTTVRRCLRAQFPVLFVDEYQDLGVPLHRIVLALCFQSGVRLFAVGDPDQSIYGFTGARPSLLRDLSKREDVHTVELRLNYRSGRKIVAASEYALGETRGYAAHRSDDGIVEFVHCPEGLKQQVGHVVDQLLPTLLAQGDRHGDIAVLYPTQYEGDVLEEGLVASAIPFVRLDKGAGYRRTPLTRLIEDFASWCCGGWSDGSITLGGMLTQSRTLMPSGSSASEHRSFRRSLVRFLFAHRDPSGPASSWLTAFDTDVFRPHLRDRSGVDADEMEALDDLLKVTAPTGQLSSLDIGLFAGKSGSPDHVCLMNLYTAKGTEFNSVLLVGMDNGRMPLYRASTTEARAEQRRLFFVGVSRAKREVHLMYSGWTMNQWGRRFDNGPSPFLVELRHKLGLGDS